MGSLLIFSLADVPAKSAEYPAAEVSPYLLTLYHQCNEPISLMWERRTGADLGLPSHDILQGRVGSLEEALEKSFFAPPT